MLASGMTQQGAHRRMVGRYEIHGKIAAGGMGTVHLGCLRGDAGVSRAVAIKRLSPHLAGDPALMRMLVDEARLTARVRHPNVVPTLDVVADGDDLLIVMDYVVGETLAALLRRVAERELHVPVSIATALGHGVLLGLHAAHEARDANGKALDLVHRDVSPQNVMVGADGVPRVLDFGIAKAAGRSQTTTEDGRVKGKLGYVAPEQVESSRDVDRRADIFATAIVIWEVLARRRLFTGETAAEVVGAIVSTKARSLRDIRDDVPAALDAALARALEKKPQDRFETAADFARALEEASPLATSREIAAWVDSIAGDRVRERAAQLAAVEREEGVEPAPPSVDGDKTIVDESYTPSEAHVAEVVVSGEVASPVMPRRVMVAIAVVALLSAFALAMMLRTRTVEPNVSVPSPDAALAAQPPDETLPALSAPIPDVDAATAAPTKTPLDRPPATPPRTKPARPPKPDCKTPFLIDSRGIRVPRPECF